MKALFINGSPRKDSNTMIAFNEIIKEFEKENIEYEIIDVGNKDIRGCMACGYCHTHGKCVFNDLVNEVAEKFEKADALIIGSPVYYGSANGSLISFLDRLFYSSNFDKRMKVGASVVVARRGGLSATFDELNKYFTITQMPIASSSYWNQIHGCEKGEAKFDEEGLLIMRNLGRNIIFLMRSIELGKEKYGLPEKEKAVFTNFVR
ncbi:MAG: flavodoxin family protein [Erysipelotrichaceae bacterium]|nr:flavodoxin family protein [Erysipelotrichaceae bacterium]